MILLTFYSISDTSALDVDSGRVARLGPRRLSLWMTVGLIACRKNGKNKENIDMRGCNTPGLSADPEGFDIYGLAWRKASRRLGSPHCKKHSKYKLSCTC